MNILLVSGKKHTALGGGERYNYFLITELLKHNHKITEVPCLPDNCEKNKASELIKNKNYNLDNKFLTMWNKSIFSKLKALSYISKKAKNFDIIINSSGFSIFSFNTKKNAVFVVHTWQNKYRIWEKIKTNPINLLFLFNPILMLFKIKIINPIRKAKNLIVFTYPKRKITGQLCQKIAIPVFNNKNNININKFEKNKIVYIGRYLPHIKGLDLLANIANKLKKNIYCYGYGDLSFFKKSKFLKNCGFVSEEKIVKILNEAKVVLLPSRWEAASFVRLNSYIMGTPIIIFDAYNLADKSIIKIKKDIIPSFNILKFSERVNEILNMTNVEYKQYSKICYMQAKQISQLPNKFGNNWNKILLKIKNNNKHFI